MNKEELERALRYTKEKHKNDKLCTFATDISGMCYDVLYVLSRCIEIPDGATNGNMIKAMFPYIEIKDNCDMYYSVNIENLSTDKGLNTVGFKKDWWNAPYKRGDKDNE